MFARGLVSLHTPPPLGRKPSSVKSRVSITSKLIQTKGLQVHYFGHSRKTGGRGSYGHLTKDVHPELAEGLFSYSPFLQSTPKHFPRDLRSNPLTPIIPTRLSRAFFERDARPSRKSNYSRTYGIPRGWGSGPGRPTACSPRTFQTGETQENFPSVPGVPVK
jgi:hypothetical protein